MQQNNIFFLPAYIYILISHCWEKVLFHFISRKMPYFQQLCATFGAHTHKMIIKEYIVGNIHTKLNRHTLYNTKNTRRQSYGILIGGPGMRGIRRCPGQKQFLYSLYTLGFGTRVVRQCRRPSVCPSAVFTFKSQWFM